MTESEIRNDNDERLSRAASVIDECRLIATMSEETGKITRRFLTPAVAEVHTHLTGRMQSLGMTVTVDSVGNLRGVWTPEISEGERLVMGSHIDSVPNAGAFDGVLGVILALAWVKIAQQLNLPRVIEVIAFSEEEGVRFGVPFLGSRAVAGTFTEDLLSLTDADGISVETAIRSFGLDPFLIHQATINEAVAAFIEIHIEQGPVLESEGLQLAVVDGIVGQTRLNLKFLGQPNHAGTTPMHLRHDALAAAAEWISSVETYAVGEHGLVATVGKLKVEPNAGNVIPGIVDVSLDVRHLQDATRKKSVDHLVSAAHAIGKRRGCHVKSFNNLDAPSVAMEEVVTSLLADSIVDAGYLLKRMPSGAGHDAMMMAARFPTAMLFLRSPGGISHHPDETVLEEDVEAALLVAERFLPRLVSR